MLFLTKYEILILLLFYLQVSFMRRPSRYLSVSSIETYRNLLRTAPVFTVTPSDLISFRFYLSRRRLSPSPMIGFPRKHSIPPQITIGGAAFNFSKAPVTHPYLFDRSIGRCDLPWCVLCVQYARRVASLVCVRCDDNFLPFCAKRCDLYDVYCAAFTRSFRDSEMEW